jgi:hypothetical protein
LEGLVGIFYGHLVCFKAVWYLGIIGHLVYLIFPIAPRKIWQHWSTLLFFFQKPYVYPDEIQSYDPYVAQVSSVAGGDDTYVMYMNQMR